ncbi:MAG: hypothetical protein CME99_04870 [Hyphomonas sp.]|nr:hypothetical protein [Hyphomonas sp.]OUX88307.1 MAG: hypothetical protein CBB91_04635 [Hyphomonas sp. TMED31]HBH45579.1 hypothetical protein [Hyphomonas atlantica]
MLTGRTAVHISRHSLTRSSDFRGGPATGFGQIGRLDFPWTDNGAGFLKRSNLRAEYASANEFICANIEAEMVSDT